MVTAETGDVGAEGVFELGDGRDWRDDEPCFERGERRCALDFYAHAKIGVGGEEERWRTGVTTSTVGGVWSRNSIEF